MSSMKTVMADHEKDILARALEPLAWMLNLWAPRNETPVTTGRMIVAVAVTVEMGSEKARILYRTTLQRNQPQTKSFWEIIKTDPPIITSPTKSYADVSRDQMSSIQLTTGAKRERACIDRRILGSSE